VPSLAIGNIATLPRVVGHDQTAPAGVDAQLTGFVPPDGCVFKYVRAPLFGAIANELTPWPLPRGPSTGIAVADRSPGRMDW